MPKTWEQEQYVGEEVLDRVKRELREDREGLRQDHRKMSEELRSALELVQYREQESENRSSAFGVWPTDAGMFRLWRYIKAQIRIRYPVNISVEPRDRADDPQAAKAAKRFLENELVHQRWKLYDDIRDRWVGAAIAMRAGCYRWDFAHELGESGEIVPRFADARMVSWPSGYLTPHDPLCPRMSELFRMPINEARRQPGWKHADSLKSDGGMEVLDAMLAANTSSATTDYIGTDPGRDNGVSDMIGGEGFFTGVMHWYRFDPKTKTPVKALERAEQYMRCGACGFETPPLGDIQEMAQGFEYPEAMDGGCPVCEGPMIRQDEAPMSNTDKALAKGKRLVIVALNGSVSEPLYDGPWPCPIARTFPYAWLTRYRYPHKRLPESDPAIHWTATIGRNFTMAVIYRQAHRSRGLWLLPEIGLKDRNGFRYDLGDDQDDVAFFGKDMPPPGVNHIPSAPVNEALFGLHQMLAGAFKENEGSSDISLTPEQSKDIPVGTVEQLTETGNVPIDDYGRDVYSAESISFGVLLDYIRWFGTTRKSIRYYNEQGLLDWEYLKGADLPDADVVVSAGARMSQVRQEEIAAYQGLASLPAPRRRRLGQLMGIDASFLNEMEQDDIATIEWQAKMDMAARAIVGDMGGGQPPPPPGADMPPGIMERMNGAQAPLNGSTA